MSVFVGYTTSEPQRPSQGPSPHDRADMRRVQEDLAPLFVDGAIHEIMAIMPKTGVLDLRTDQLSKALDFVQRQDTAGAIGLYVGNNPLGVRVGGPDKTRPNNQSVIARCNLFFDFDRAETSNHLATHDELATIHRARQHAQDVLARRGFPAEASRAGVTGNGEYLIYQTDHLPVDAETNTLIKRAVRALKMIVEAEYPTVKLDTVTDAVRVRRISGTINRKHDEHRMCMLNVHVQEPVTREMLEALAARAPAEDRLISTQPVSLTFSDQEIIERLHREKNGQGIGPALLRGDKSGYPDYSSARYALANKAAFYSDDVEQAERILRSSNLFDPANTDRERDRKAKNDARKALSEYIGPRYHPTYGDTPRFTGGPDANPDTSNCAELRAQLKAAYALIAQKDETIVILQERIRRLDERDAIQRNTKLGAARTTAAALANLFREEQPKEPGIAAGWRMPLAKLSDRTGLSADACSRQIHKLAEYKADDNTPLLHVDVRSVPRTVIQDTGEIIEPHKELWIGPGVPPAEFGRVLATIAPATAPKHGGAPDRNVCPDHPNAGTIRRSKTIRRITRECAHCHKELSSEDIEIGREESSYIRPIQHDAFANASPPNPMPQHAASTGIHIPLDLYRNMPDSPDRDRRAAYWRGEAS